MNREEYAFWCVVLLAIAVWRVVEGLDLFPVVLVWMLLMVMRKVDSLERRQVR